jgi:hypothetical protein
MTAEIQRDLAALAGLERELVEATAARDPEWAQDVRRMIDELSDDLDRAVAAAEEDA